MNNYKVVLLGATFVGKTTITKQIMYNQFYEQSESTIGCSFFKKKMNIEDKDVWLNIYDTAGSQRFNTLLPMYIKGAHAIIFVYDVTDINSYDKIKLLLSDKLINQSLATMMLVGNKNDLQRIINIDEAKNFAKQNLLLFDDISATSYQDVHQLFSTLASTLVNQYGSQTVDPTIILTKDNKVSHCCY
jgi:small GTP-binding protein